MNQGSLTGFPLSTMDSQLCSQPDARYHLTGADQHSAAFSASSLLIPLQPAFSFPSVSHSGLLPAALPYHHSAQATMASQPGLKTLGHSSISPHSPSYYSRPVFRQALTSEPSHKLPSRAIPEMDFVMWVGNLESSASLDELYTFFRQIDPIPLPPVQSAVVSIMYMPSTNCALVNMRNEATLREAVERFHGSRLRPNTKLARLVCRSRGSESAPESSLMKLPESGPSRCATAYRVP